MKLALMCALCLLVAIAAIVAIGITPTVDKWGDAGRTSLYAIAFLCGGASLGALVPLAIVAVKFPDYIGQAAFAGTVIRLLLTMTALVAYQILYQPHMASFLFWAPIFYIVLLAIETTFGVLAVKRYYRVTPKENDGATS